MNLLLSLALFLSYLGVFLYSYGFVDFNLTLSSHPAVMSFVSWAQELAMFNRPLSLRAYLLLLALTFGLYLTALIKSRPNSNFPWATVAGLALIGALAYPFLSYDVFKYLFSARMVVDYGLNPHTTSPNLVPGDDLWLRFMRWIHTPSPYGPVMTALAIPYYLLGFKKFTLTLYLFKLDQAAWYLLSVWLIGRLAGKLKLEKGRAVLAQLFFALNPLIILEWLFNAHNDAPMLTLLLLALYLLSFSRRLVSFIVLLVSIGIKFVTVVFLPFILLRKPRFTLLFINYFLLFTLTLAPYFYHYSNQFQPWYVTWIIPFAALSASPTVYYLTGAYSLGALLRYLPFISTGLWVGSSTNYAFLTYTPLLLTAIFLGFRRYQSGKL